MAQVQLKTISIKDSVPTDVVLKKVDLKLQHLLKQSCTALEKLNNLHIEEVKLDISDKAKITKEKKKIPKNDMLVVK